MKGVFRVDYEWGYFSEKDGERHAFDLCETAMMHFSNRF